MKLNKNKVYVIANWYDHEAITQIIGIHFQGFIGSSLTFLKVKAAKEQFARLIM